MAAHEERRSRHAAADLDDDIGEAAGRRLDAGRDAVVLKPACDEGLNRAFLARMAFDANEIAEARGELLADGRRGHDQAHQRRSSFVMTSTPVVVTSTSS